MELPVLIAYSNNGYVTFAINMLLNFTKVIKNHRLHFYCLDEQIYSTLTTYFGSNPLFTFQLVNANVTSGFESYGSEKYNAICYLKNYFIRDSLARFKFIHFLDCDIVCVNEPPADFYESFKNYDIVYQYDTGATYESGPLHPLYNTWACAGNASFRDTPGTKYILDEVEKLQKENNGNDQECLKRYFDLRGMKDLREEKNAKLSVYPIELYTNGYMINNNRLTLKDTYFFHANHIIGGYDKRKLLMKVNQWYLNVSPHGYIDSYMNSTFSNITIYNHNLIILKEKHSTLQNVGSMQLTLHEWQQTIKRPEFIISCASIVDGSDAPRPFPVGMGFQYGLYFTEFEALQIGRHDKTVIAAFGEHTSLNNARRNYAATLSKNSIVNAVLSSDVYFRNLPSYKFVISPGGTGQNTHRIYEALMAGCIPVCEDCTVLRELFVGCPILYTRDYSEITPQYLEEIYPTILSKNYDFSRLFSSYYSDEQRIDMHESRKFWVEKIGKDYMETWNSQSYQLFREICSRPLN